MSPGDPPKGTPPPSKPGSDDDSPPSSQSSPDAAPKTDPSPGAPVSSPAPDSTPPAADSAQAAPSESAPSSAPTSDDAPPDSTPPASGDSAPSSAPDSTNDDSGDCAEIPCAAHAVLTGEVKLVVQIPYPMDQASQLPHKLTLANDDSSYSKTLTLASDCQTGDAEGTSVVTFEDLTEQHTYTLQCDDGDTSYAVFKDVPYDQLVQQLGAQGSGGTAASSPSTNPSGGSADTTGTP